MGCQLSERAGRASQSGYQAGPAGHPGRQESRKGQLWSLCPLGSTSVRGSPTFQKPCERTERLSYLWRRMSWPRAQTLRYLPHMPRSLQCSLPCGPNGGLQGKRVWRAAPGLSWVHCCTVKADCCWNRLGQGGMETRPHPGLSGGAFPQERSLEAMRIEEYLVGGCSRGPGIWPLIGSSWLCLIHSHCEPCKCPRTGWPCFLSGHCGW